MIEEEFIPKIIGEVLCFYTKLVEYCNVIIFYSQSFALGVVPFLLAIIS